MKRLPILSMAFAAAVLLLAVAACGGGDREETQRQSSAISSLSGELEQAHSGIDNAAVELTALGNRLGDVEEGIDGFTAVAGVHALSRNDGIPDPPPGKMALHMSFDYLPDALPGEGIRIHTPAPDVRTVWAMESLPKGQPVPAGDPIKDNTVFLEPGGSELVTLVFENPTSQDVGFLGMPHQESPGELHTKTWLTCFCLAFIYEAPAEGAWYRVIKVAASPDMPVGAKVDARWTILTDPTVFPTD